MKYSKELQNYVKTLFRKDGLINVAILRQQWFKDSKEYTKIINTTKWFGNSETNIKSRIYLIQNGITSEKDYPDCEICGNKVQPNELIRFRRTCSRKCGKVLGDDKRLEVIKENNKNKISSEKIVPLLERIDTIIKYINETPMRKLDIFKLNFKIPKCKNPNCNRTANCGNNGFNDYCSKRCKETDEEYCSNLSKSVLETYKNNGIAILEKSRSIALINYGVEVPQTLDIVKNKAQKTCLIKYGVRNWSQLGLQEPPNTFQWKEYIYPSGSIIQIQGYEWKLLDELLLNGYTEDVIKTNRKDIPEIWYIGEDDKSHRYFPDAYIPSINTIYEVKSTYTMQKEFLKNMLKFQAVKDAGYNFKLKVYN